MTSKTLTTGTDPADEADGSVVEGGEAEADAVAAGRTDAPVGLRMRVVAAAVTVALVAGLVVTALVLHGKVGDDKKVADARTAATKAAGTAVPAILSYGYETIDHDIATALSYTTGSFTGNLKALETTVVRPTAVSKKVVSKTVVTATSVVHASPDTVDLLIYTTQTSSQKSMAPQVVGSRLDVTMHRSGGRWLVSALKPI